MLKKLSVRNFAVISLVEFEPKVGLNVFTGETGAGKSVAISALSFALGARGSASLIKDGADKLEVRAEFDASGLPHALLQKYAAGEKTLVFTRTLDRKGKSKAFINGRAVPAAALAELGKELVDFHGQHEHQSLLRADVPLVGAMFTPAYGQSYYEIFTLGHYDRNVRATHPFNAPSARLLAALRIPVAGATLSLGYLGDVRQADVAHLKRHLWNHQFMIGYERTLRLLRPRR